MTLRPQDLDTSVDPGVDFYRFANGGWIDTNPIPPGYGSWGSFEELGERNDATIRAMLEEASTNPQNELDRLLGDFYASGMDLDAIEAAGITAIQPMLGSIDAAAGLDDVLTALPSLHQAGMLLLFAGGVTPDFDDGTVNQLWLVPTGLGLPDRDAYFAEGEAPAALRAAYAQHVAAQLGNLGSPLAAHADDVVALETRLAEVHLKAEEKRDPSNTLNRHDMAALTALAPGLDLPGYLRTMGLGHLTSVNVQQPRYFAALHDILADTPLDTLKAHLAFHVVRTVADALPATFDHEAFEFYGRRVNGQQQPHERSKRIIAALGADVGDAIGQRFVAATFTPEAKERALRMVEAIVDEMRHSLQTRPWMTDETRARGLTKLDAIRVKIGYPDEWRDWSGLQVDRATYAANRIAASRFELEHMLDQLSKPVDVNEWDMPPHVVNAYYHPTRNEIVFPAGILRPPMFDADADDAVNFGGIGTVIAHEISHGFDDQGRRFDADGAFRDWWTPEDEAAYGELTTRLAAQFDEYVAIDEVHVNGQLTLGENIADLGGIALAVRAHARVSDGAPSIDGFTPAQRFFLANAAIWRCNVSGELRRTLAQVDSHSPRELRVRGPLSNLQEFQDAFGLADEAPMMRPRPERIEIW
jgi:predicted metalloendopeptidase